jgi:hypothetical protein
MNGWRQRVQQLLYDGEDVRETVEVDGSTVVVTSHRLLASTPEGDGANFRQVDRPNVEDISTGARSEGRLLQRAIRYGLVGVVLVVAAQFVNLDGLVGGVDLTPSTSELGIGSVLGPLQGLLNLLAQLDQLLQLFGGLALLLSAILLGVYWYTREATLVIAVAGDDDIHVPRPADASDQIERLERALSPSPADDGDAIPRDPLRES